MPNKPNIPICPNSINYQLPHQKCNKNIPSHQIPIIPNSNSSNSFKQINVNSQTSINSQIGIINPCRKQINSPTSFNQLNLIKNASINYKNTTSNLRKQ